MLNGSLLAVVLAAVPIHISDEPPVALARGGSGTVCHCPCRTTLCDCTMHSETCHRCFGLGVTLSADALNAMFASTERPVLQSADADWFHADAYPEIRVRLEAMTGSGASAPFEVRFVPDPLVASRYVPDGTFDGRTYAAWLRRVDRTRAATLSMGAKDDPATWRILDGNAQHLNDSLQKSFRLVRLDGSSVEVFRSDSTLEWEANLYLRSVVAGIPHEGLLGDPETARSALLSLVDLVDLQVKSGDMAGAVLSLDRLIDAASTRWLDPSKEDTTGALCGFRKIRNLLVPGSSCA